MIFYIFNQLYEMIFKTVATVLLCGLVIINPRLKSWVNGKRIHIMNCFNSFQSSRFYFTQQIYLVNINQLTEEEE